MPNPGPGLVIVLALVPFASGCVARHRACAPPELTRPGGLLPVVPTEDDSAVVETDLIRSFADRARTANAPGTVPARPAKFLALSGGGMYGAYSTGVLAGWSAAGTRPCFDVVTGVSTGGLIATFAFLGPEYDRRLVEVFTSITDRDVYRKRPVGAFLWSDAAASSAPLKRLIAARVDDDLLRAVARAHAAGRRLYVGTTDINTRRLVIWDMGGIAASGRPDAKDLYRNVLLASASPPGFLPPVEMGVEINGRRYSELHVDGGATTGVFLRASTLHVDPNALKTGQQPLAGSDAYVIVAGKLYADPGCTDRRAVRIGESALQSLLYSQTRGELYRIYTLCQLGRMKYHLASIPEDVKIGTDAMGFDPDEMRRLYAAGYAAAAGGRAWRDTPPGAEPHEQTRPRDGNQFFAPGAAQLPPPVR
jgi:hypothetical protein